MNSTFKLSLLAAVFAFAAPAAVMAASTTHHPVHHHAASHRVRHVKGKKTGHGHGHSAYSQNKDSQNQATRDLNARSLQTVQSVNRDPNTGVLSPQSSAGQPPTPVGQAPMNPPPSMGNPGVPSNALGAVNPNNMPPAD